MAYTIKQTANIMGISVRTLQYYDSIGLLCPATLENGYRQYTVADIKSLEKILFLKELGFSLKEIKDNPDILTDFEVMTKMKCLLEKKKKHIERSIITIETILKGDEPQMAKNEYLLQKEIYRKEAKELWGHTKEYAESEKKTSAYSDEKWNSLENEIINIFKNIANLSGNDPSDVCIQDLIKQWQNYITENFYNCSKETLKNLGLMYTQDQRFKDYFDNIKSGLSEYIAQAIQIYCNEHD